MGIKILSLILYLNFNTNVGFTLSYYFVPYGCYSEMEELNVIPKGINIGFSYEKKNLSFRINSGFIKGGSKDYFYSIVLYPSISKTDFKEIWGGNFYFI